MQTQWFCLAGVGSQARVDKQKQTERYTIFIISAFGKSGARDAQSVILFFYKSYFLAKVGTETPKSLIFT